MNLIYSLVVLMMTAYPGAYVEGTCATSACDSGTLVIREVGFERAYRVHADRTVERIDVPPIQGCHDRSNEER